MYDISNIDQDVKKHTIMFEKVNIEIIKMITVILIATMVFVSLSLLSGQTGKAAALLGYGLITIVLVGGGAGGGSSGIPLSLIMSFVSFLIIVVASYSADNLLFFVTAFFSVALCIRFLIRAIVLYEERQESSFIFDEEDDGEFEPVFIVDKYYKKVIGCIVLVFFATAFFLLVGCANIAPNPEQKASSVTSIAPELWEGRLSLAVVKAIEDGQVKGESFFAHFVLSGNSSQGSLRLLTPLGGVFADIDWSPAQAQLIQDGHTRSFDTMDNLLLAAIGQSFPMLALFDWLHGKEHLVAGWKSNFEALGKGRLSAEGLSSEPRLRLKISLARPSWPVSTKRSPL